MLTLGIWLWNFVRGILLPSSPLISSNKTFAELHCLQAAKTTSSGARIPVTIHLKFLNLRLNEVSSFPGIFRCIADQTHKLNVRRQDSTREKVPRPFGSLTQLTVWVPASFAGRGAPVDDFEWFRIKKRRVAVNMVLGLNVPPEPNT